MAPKHKIQIDQGATFRMPVYYRQPLVDEAGDAILDDLGKVQAGPPNDLTGYVARMHIRHKIADTATMVELTSSPPAGITVYTPTVRMLGYVKAASTGIVTPTGPQTIDAVACVAGDRVLLKDQADPASNGIYVVDAGAWARASDADSAADLTANAAVWVWQGRYSHNVVWRQEATLANLTVAQNWQRRTDVGRIEIVITDEQTEEFLTSGKYDLELESSGGEVYRILEGDVRLSLEVTREA